MTHLRRSITILTFGLGAQMASAKTMKYPGTFWDHVAMISTTWWATTLVATFLLGILVGYFAYRSAVNNGRAGGATGSGCLVAVIIFLLCQGAAIVVLAITLFNLPATYTDLSQPPGKTSAPDAGAVPAKKPDAPKNNGDDF